MNALEKLKLSKELRSLLGGMDGLKAMEKLKAAKRVRELVALLGGGESKERSEYPFGKLDESDSYQFNGYRVRVLPGAGGLGDPWEGEVVDLRNHGRLVEVRKDGMAPGSLSIRVSGDRIVVLSAPKGHESTVNGSAPKPVDAPSQQQEAKPYTPEPYAGPRDVSSRAGQMELAQRAGTIASLKAMNSQLRQIAPSEAWDDRAIEEADDLDSVRDMISNALVAAARSAQARIPNQEMEYAIKIAADSLDQLRKSDVYRVLTENPENVRAALATYIKNGRPDLAQEVDEVLQELDEEAAAAEEKQKPVWKAYWMGESREAFVIRDSAEKMASYIAENSIKNFFVYQSSGEKLLDVYVSGDYMEPIGYLMPRERATLNEYQADLVNAKAGRGLGKVLGRNHNRVYNDSKKVAIEWLNKNIAEYSTLIKAMEQAKTAPAWPFATADAQTPSNPLYQSVIDGAEITLPLIEQVIEEAEKNGDDANPQLAQAVAVVEEWATAQGWDRAVLDSLYAALFGYGGDYDVYGVA